MNGTGWEFPKGRKTARLSGGVQRWITCKDSSGFHELQALIKQHDGRVLSDTDGDRLLVLASAAELKEISLRFPAVALSNVLYRGTSLATSSSNVA